MRTCYFDFETRSECDIRKAGADVYARHPSTEVLCCAFKIDDGPTQIWHPFGELDYSLTEPPKFKELHSPPKATPKDMEFVAHNATFDLLIWEHVAVPKYGFPPLPLSQVRDTMAQGCAMALPASLAGLGEALRVEQQKYDGGSKLIRKMSVPPYEFTPALFAEMMDYCGIDVETMAEIDQHLLPLQPQERKMWELNHRINQRGISIDFNLIEAIARLNVQADMDLEDMLKPLGLTASNVRSQAQFKAWALTHGVEIPSLNKKELGAMSIEDPVVLQGLELREQVCKSSIKKFDAMSAMSCKDGKIRGNHVYHRATTGRFAGGGVQVQNMPRPVVDDTDALAESILAGGSAEGYNAPVKDVLASLVRACLVGDFTCADFSSIESRVLFWLADCQKGLDVYRKGDDLYCVTAEGIFGKPVNKKDNPFERSIGKIAVLACGYQGATKAFKGMCDGYGLAVDEDQQRQAVQGYRDTYPEVVSFWYDCEQAALDAIRKEQSVQRVGRIAYKYDGKSLKCRLPSGRVIHWQEPAIIPGKFDRETIEYSGVNIARKWTRKTTYAGDLAQSATQAVARDLLCEAMLRLDEAGWPIVLHVHDEILADGKGEGDFLEIMTQLPDWAEGLPVTGDLWTGGRYQK